MGCCILVRLQPPRCPTAPWRGGSLVGIRRRQTRRATSRLGSDRNCRQRIAPRLWASGSEGSEARFALGERLASGRTVNLTTDARAIGNQREQTQSTKVPRASHWDGGSASGRRKNVG